MLVHLVPMAILELGIGGYSKTYQDAPQIGHCCAWFYWF
jgi:hypothetical protein